MSLSEAASNQWVWLGFFTPVFFCSLYSFVCDQKVGLIMNMGLVSPNNWTLDKWLLVRYRGEEDLDFRPGRLELGSRFPGSLDRYVAESVAV